MCSPTGPLAASLVLLGEWVLGSSNGLGGLPLPLWSSVSPLKKGQARGFLKLPFSYKKILALPVGLAVHDGSNLPSVDTKIFL